MERIPADGWQAYVGHVDRYVMAAGLCRPGDRVLDAACGVGYGAEVMSNCREIVYVGADRPDVPDARFAHLGSFLAVDLDEWIPPAVFDVGVCFETLEHLRDPARFARLLSDACERSLIVSAPTVPTAAGNPHHLHDFTLDSLLALFADRPVVEVVPQPAELSHIVVFGERG